MLGQPKPLSPASASENPILDDSILRASPPTPEGRGSIPLAQNPVREALNAREWPLCAWLRPNQNSEARSAKRAFCLDTLGDETREQMHISVRFTFFAGPTVSPNFVSWFVSQPLHPCPSRVSLLSVARVQVKGREQRPKPHEHCPSVSLAIRLCRSVRHGG